MRDQVPTILHPIDSLLANRVGSFGAVSAGVAAAFAVPDRRNCCWRGFRAGLGHRDITGPVAAGIGVIPIPTPEFG